ncbi:MAG: four helix bundle protein [Pseudomonadota bacterium]
MPRNYKELKVWQNSYQLSQDIDRATDTFPEHEGFILATQMKKAAVSIPKYIARGYRKKTTPEYIKLLYVAYRSTYELEMHIILSGDLGYINKEQLSVLHGNISELEKMLRFMIKTLEK